MVVFQMIKLKRLLDEIWENEIKYDIFYNDNLTKVYGNWMIG